MPSPDDFDRMVMASLGPPGAMVPPMLPPDGVASTQADSTDGGGVLTLGLGIAAALLLALLVALV